jgi:hypothetical protein
VSAPRIGWVAQRDKAQFGIREGDRITFAEGHTLLVRSLDAQTAAAVMAEIRGESETSLVEPSAARPEKVSRALEMGGLLAGFAARTPEGDQ